MAVKPVASKEDVGGQALFEMANLRPERTGLPFVVFISQKGGARHDVRLKVARSAHPRRSEMITVALRPSPRIVRGTLSAHEFGLLKRWVDLNRDVLVDYWDGIIEYTEDALQRLRPIGSPEEPSRPVASVEQPNRRP